VRVVEFLAALGVDQQALGRIFRKRPQVSGCGAYLTFSM